MSESCKEKVIKRGCCWNPLLEASWKLLGLSWDLPRVLLGRSWAPLDLPWGALGRPLGALGCSRGTLVRVRGRSVVLLGASGAPGRVPRASQDPFWDDFGALWEGFGDDFGRNLGATWQLLGHAFFPSPPVIGATTPRLIDR